VYCDKDRPVRESSRTVRGPESPPAAMVPSVRVPSTASQREPPVAALKRAKRPGASAGAVADPWAAGAFVRPVFDASPAHAGSKASHPATKPIVFAFIAYLASDPFVETMYNISKANIPTMSRSPAVIQRPAQIRLLASPVRQEIVDTLEALGGEAPVAAIAAHLGRPSDGLYYHLRILVRGGLLEELPDEGEGRRFRTRARRSERLRLRYEPGRTANARAGARVVGSMLRTTRRDFVSALADPDVVIDGEKRALRASRVKGWVAPADLAELNRLFARASELLRPKSEAKGAQLMSLTWVLTPVRAMPSRRG
jgi:DNA-binding transcriptional ArsR family regulator